MQRFGEQQQPLYAAAGLDVDVVLGICHREAEVTQTQSAACLYWRNGHVIIRIFFVAASDWGNSAHHCSCQAQNVVRIIYLKVINKYDVALPLNCCAAC